MCRTLFQCPRYRYRLCPEVNFMRKVWLPVDSELLQFMDSTQFLGGAFFLPDSNNEKHLYLDQETYFKEVFIKHSCKRHNLFVMAKYTLACEDTFIRQHWRPRMDWHRRQKIQYIHHMPALTARDGIWDIKHQSFWL